MKWLTLKSNDTIWHVDMDKISTIRIDLAEDGKPEKISFWYPGEEEPSLVFEKEEENVETIMKSVEEFLTKHRK